MVGFGISAGMGALLELICHASMKLPEPTAFTGELGSDKNQQKPLVMNE